MNDFFSSKARANQVFRRQLGRIRDAGGECFAFGGFPRSVYMSGGEANPKDVDLVFDRSSFDAFLSESKPYIKKRNRFGGANLLIEGVDIDAWCIEDTWAFNEGYFSGQIGFSTLPRTTYLSFDAIAVELWPKKGASRRIYSAGFFETFDRKSIDLNFDPNPFPELTVVRTLVAAKRFSLMLSATLARATAKLMLECGSRQIYQAQLDHYKTEYFSLDQLGGILVQLVRHLNERCGLPYKPFSARVERQLHLVDELACTNSSLPAEEKLGVQLKLFS